MSPKPLDGHIRARMERQARSGTAPELAIRRELHRRGLRYRVDTRPPVPSQRSRPDLLFTRAKVAVFIDGCFWHGCADHFTVPKNNREWWLEKIEANRVRDSRNTALLESAGYTVIRVWEHEAPMDAADRVQQVVRERLSTKQRGEIGGHAA